MTMTKQQNWYGWYVVFISSMIGFSMTASFPQFTMVVGDYAAELHTTEEFLLFTDTIKSISIMIAMLLSGPVYKRLGLRRTFVFAIASMVIPQVLMPYAINSFMVLILKIIQGFCAVIFPVFLIIIMGWMNRSNIGTATAVFNGIFYGGSGIGATVAGFTISSLGWKTSFSMIALMTLVPSILWFATVKENGEPQQDHCSDGEHSPLNENTFQVVLKSFQTWVLILCLFSTIWMTQVLSVDLPLYGNFLQYDSEAIGLLMSSLSLGIFLACVISGKISDYFSKKSNSPAIARLVVFSFGPILTIVSILLTLFINKSSFPLFYFTTLLLSFSSAWGLGSFYCILPELLDKRILEYSTGFIGGIADIGMPVGPLVFGVFLGMKGFWTAAWIICILITIISLLGSVILINHVKLRHNLRNQIKTEMGSFISSS